jgi:hypothetical protein
MVPDISDCPHRGATRPLHGGGGSDTGWRQVFPLTYDIPLDHPQAVRTAEDD